MNRKVFLAAAVFFALFIPALTFADGLAGPIVPQTSVVASNWYYNLCDLRVVANSIISFSVAFSVVVATLVFAYGGILYVTAAANKSQISKAHSVLMKAFTGVVIVLLAWLLVNIILSVLTGQGIDFWVQIDQSACTNPTSAAFAPANSTINSESGFPSNNPGSNPSQNAKGACSASGLESYGMDSNIAPTMSCITKSEDGACILGEPSGTDVGTDGKSVSYGIFQVNISANNLSQYPACEAAVGGAPLNCTSAFNASYVARNANGTHVLPNQQGLYNRCVQAASNPQCNIQAAQDLYQNHGGSRNWGTAAQNACGH